MILQEVTGVLGSILGPKADMCLLMDVHGVSWMIRALPTLM